MKLTEKQVSYLKSLESKKKRRMFLLDCLVENLIGESAKINTRKLSDFPSTQINEHVKVFHTNTTAPRTFEGIMSEPFKIKKECERIGKKFLKEKHSFQTNELVYITDSNGIVKSGYIEKPKNENEFEIILCDINWEPLLYKNLTVCNFAPFLEKKYTEEDVIRAFEKGNHATCNAFTLRETPSDSQLKLYADLKDEFIKSLKND